MECRSWARLWTYASDAWLLPTALDQQSTVSFQFLLNRAPPPQAYRFFSFSSSAASIANKSDPGGRDCTHIYTQQKHQLVEGLKRQLRKKVKCFVNLHKRHSSLT
jgi:hypothetical protein